MSKPAGRRQQPKRGKQKSKQLTLDDYIEESSTVSAAKDSVPEALRMERAKASPFVSTTTPPVLKKLEVALETTFKSEVQGKEPDSKISPNTHHPNDTEGPDYELASLPWEDNHEATEEDNVVTPSTSYEVARKSTAGEAILPVATGKRKAPSTVYGTWTKNDPRFRTQFRGTKISSINGHRVVVQSLPSSSKSSFHPGLLAGEKIQLTKDGKKDVSVIPCIEFYSWCISNQCFTFKPPAKHPDAGTLNEKVWYDGRGGLVPAYPYVACAPHYPVGNGRGCACRGIEAQLSSSESDSDNSDGTNSSPHNCTDTVKPGESHPDTGTLNEKVWYDGCGGLVPANPYEFCAPHHPIGNGRACACSGIDAQMSSSESNTDQSDGNNSPPPNPDDEQHDPIQKKRDEDDDDDVPPFGGSGVPGASRSANVLASSSTSARKTSNQSESTGSTDNNVKKNAMKLPKEEDANEFANGELMLAIDTSLAHVHSWNNVTSLRHFVYDNLFSRVKFIESNEFTTPTTPVALYIMNAMCVPFDLRREWWEDNHNLVKKFLSIKRSGVVQNMWSVYNGECLTILPRACYPVLTSVCSVLFVFLVICKDSCFPTERQLTQIHQYMDSYKLLMENMLPIVIGRPKWKREKGVVLLSTFATPSDEAFVFVAVSNSMERWSTRHKNVVNYEGVSDRPLPYPKFTRGPVKPTYNIPVNPTTLRGKGGWNLRGRMEFVNFHRATVEHRKTRTFVEFEASLLAKYAKNGMGRLTPGMDMPPMPMDIPMDV